MKAVVLDGYTINPGDLTWSPVADLCDELTVYDRTPAELALERMKDCDAVFSSKLLMDRAVFEACPGLRYIGVLATGYNQVKLDDAKAAGIRVTNVPDYSTDAVVQFTIALLLELCHHAGYHNEANRGPRGLANQDFCFWDYPQTELAGKTIGLVGFGNIGRGVARAAGALGLQVLACTPHPGEAAGVEFVSLEELLRRSDIVSLHCPLTPENGKLINRDTLALMKPTAWLLNTARGGLVDEEALAEALNRGTIAAAAVDVVTREPMRRETCPLMDARNCIITPHIAWASREARQRLIDITAANFSAWLQGKEMNVIV